MSVYKACDIRGVYGVELTEELAYHIGRAAGTKLQGRKTVVGGDVRLSTPALTRAIIRGLRESGANVTNLGVVPTPAFYYGKDLLGATGGVMVTASHNPPEDNGFKLVFGDQPVTEADIADVERRVTNRDYSTGEGDYEEANIIGDYQKFVLDQLAQLRTSNLSGSDRSAALRVVVDAGNGCYSHIAPRLFEKAGYEVVRLFCEPDGAFLNRMPNPAIAENLAPLCRRVIEAGAQIGVAFDGDGDRVTFVDETGSPVSTDKSIAIMARNLLEMQNGKVVYDIKCSSVVPETVAACGGTPLVEKSGHAFIRRRLLNEKAVMGGEISGHFFFGSIGRDDGLLAALIFTGLVAGSAIPLSAIAGALPSYAITPDIRVPFTGDQDAVLEAIENRWAGYPISTLDGIRVQFPEGWALLRKSVTEPAMTFRFEVNTPEQLKKFIEEFLEAVPELKGKVLQRVRT